MEIRHLKLIKTVAETKNLTKAARQLYLSQSALSHQLREIEREYNAQMFVRARKQMILTNVGERLLQSANVILQELEKADCDLSNLTENDEGTLRVSTGCYTCYHWLAPTMKIFKPKYPNVRIEILPDATYSTFESLLSGQLDLALTSDWSADTNFKFCPLFEDELLCIVSPDHPWADRKRILPKDFATETFLKYNIPDEHSTIIAKYFKPNGVMPDKIMHLHLTEAIIEMVKANIGISVLAAWSVKNYIERGELIGIPVAKLKRRQWYAVALKNFQAPSYMADFIETLKGVMAR